MWEIGDCLLLLELKDSGWKKAGFWEGRGVSSVLETKIGVIQRGDVV